jgi:hypothetical protein
MAGAIITLGALTASGCETEFVTLLVPAGVMVAPHQADLSQGDDLQLTASVLDEASQAIAQAQVEWSAENRSVVQVDPDGRARGIGPGATLVWATFNGVAGSASITVVSSADCVSSATEPNDGSKRKKDDKGNKSHDDEDDDDDGDDDGKGDADDDADPRCTAPIEGRDR